ncbi:ENR1 protein, partial [Ardeotis kori]|nr:ENR1 protein [Ardeotis kori]
KLLRLSSIGKNLFVDLAERIAEELNITNCRICEGLLMSEERPWKGIRLSPLQILRWNHTITSVEDKQPLGWVLASETIGEECIRQNG